jgi:hypothetical protein
MTNDLKTVATEVLEQMLRHTGGNATPAFNQAIAKLADVLGDSKHSQLPWRGDLYTPVPVDSSAVEHLGNLKLVRNSVNAVGALAQATVQNPVELALRLDKVLLKVHSLLVYLENEYREAPESETKKRIMTTCEMFFGR